MTRYHRFTVFLVACLALLAVAGAAQATTPSRLLAKYQPVTYFTGDEAFRPTPVDGFVADSTLERFNPGTGTFMLIDPDPQLDTLPSSGAGWRPQVWKAFADPDRIRRFWPARSTGRLATGSVYLGRCSTSWSWP